MESRGWRGSASRRSLQVFFLASFCLMQQHFHFVRAAPEAYPSELDSQTLNNNAADAKTKLDSFSGLLPLSPDQDKRSSAFFPLRGKKYNPFGDFRATDPWEMSDDAYSMEDDKRSQFYPLRGKKVPDDLKRASYFMPMRGRKEDDSWAREVAQEDKRMSSFMPMRGKKSSSLLDSYQLLSKPGTYPNAVLYLSSSDSDNMRKRNMGFVPSRGKKESADSIDLPSSDAIEKRTLSFVPMRGRRSDSEEESNRGKIATSLLKKNQYSFFPMRGRKNQNGESVNSLPFNSSNFLVDAHRMTASYPEDNLEKRPSNFMAMRGRKSSIPGSDDQDMDWQQEKRKMSFLPMRGKRSIPDYTSRLDLHPEDSILGVSAEDYIRKRPSNFMAMRGRKSLLDSLRDHGFEWHQDKRQSSFMPMRGKRSVLDEPSSDENSMPPKLFHDEVDKRAPAFTPMRGRRLEGDLHLEGEENVRSPWNPMTSNEVSVRDLLEKLTREMSMGTQMERNPDFHSALSDSDKRGSSFMPMRGRRAGSSRDAMLKSRFPFYIPSGIGSSLMNRHYNGQGVSRTDSLRSALLRSNKVDWDSVKRAFHATRGKRDELKTSESQEASGEENEREDERGCRFRRSLFRPRSLVKTHREYIALKRPMSFFATRGKRMDSSAVDAALQ